MKSLCVYAHERRTWREKSTYDAKGIIEIPAMGLKQSLDRAAKVLGEQIPGKGKATVVGDPPAHRLSLG
jgi:hypothetical protein